MAVPKKRKSSAERDKHRSHDHLTAPVHLETCPTCGEVKARHRVCDHCGHYRGVKVIEVKKQAE